VGRILPRILPEWHKSISIYVYAMDEHLENQNQQVYPNNHIILQVTQHRATWSLYSLLLTDGNPLPPSTLWSSLNKSLNLYQQTMKVSSQYSQWQAAQDLRKTINNQLPISSLKKLNVLNSLLPQQEHMSSFSTKMTYNTQHMQYTF